MQINVNKEQLKGIGKAGLKIGKAIIIEGTKAVAVKGATAAIMAGFDNGTDGIKQLKLDDVIGKKDKEEKTKKKGLFGRKKKLKVDQEELTETLTDLAEDSYAAGKIDAIVEDMVGDEKEKDK